MNTYALIPLFATIAYIPLLVILLVNRPWQKRQKLFFLFLISAILWSLSDALGRSDFFMQDGLLLVKVVLCLGMWSVIQFHYVLYSFYSTRFFKIPVGYILVIGTVTLAMLGYVPQSIDVTTSGIIVNYGFWFILVVILVSLLLAKDLHFLIRRRRILADPADRNQISYLFLGIIVLLTIASISFAPVARGFPFPHVGNLLMACILTYAVVQHRLLDIRVIFRRALSSTAIVTLIIAIYLLWMLLFGKVFHLKEQLSVTILALSLTLAIGIAFWQTLTTEILGGVDRLFYGRGLEPKRRLVNFIDKIYNIPTLEQFGTQFISLLAQAINCQSACLLLPQAGETEFAACFSYPTIENNPINSLRLKMDSPAVTIMKEKAAILSTREIDILPEFGGMWLAEKEDIRAAKVELFIPLINRGEVVAILAVSHKRGGKLYRVEDIDLMESLASRMAASIEKEYLHDQVAMQRKELALINHLTTLVTSSLNIQDIIGGFAEGLKEVVDVDGMGIVLIEGRELHFLAVSGNINNALLAWEKGESVPLEGTATEWMARNKRSVYEADLARHKRFSTGRRSLIQGARSIVYLPLIVKDESIGSLVVVSRRPNAYDRRQIQLLEHLALQIATPIENSRLYARAEQRSRIDELTGLFNRRHFEERLKEEIARHSRHGNVFSLLMLDLDFFKAYNDMYGHPSGDRLLNQMGEIINSSIRDADQAFRYGGDEFAVILPQTDIKDAYLVAERVRECIAAEMEAKQVAVTCSIGLASYPSDGVMSGELVNTSDTALYYAKNTGGNRTYLSSKIFSEPGTEIEANARAGGLSAVYALAAAVDAKDHYTYGHSRKVNTYAVALAEAIGLLPDEASRISTAALLHDIGKIGVPDRILNKKGKLSDEEWEPIKSHPRLGANIVGNVPDLVPCVGSILYHHERWDGTGYPEGLKGKTIPLDARILAIADAFAAMTSARPYRNAFCHDKVLRKLREGAGTQFDPELVEVFIGLIEAGLPRKAKVGHASPSEQPSP